MKPALAMIKEATGLTDFKEILQKMERHSETISSLTQMQQTLQVKLMKVILHALKLHNVCTHNNMNARAGRIVLDSGC